MFCVETSAKEKEWIVSCREGRYFEDDKLIILKLGLGERIQDQLNAVRVNNIGELVKAMVTPAHLEELLKLSLFAKNKVAIWNRVLSDSLFPGTHTPDIIHKLAENSYLSRYPDPVLNKYGERE